MVNRRRGGGGRPGGGIRNGSGNSRQLAGRGRPRFGCTATAHIDSQWGSGPSGGEIVSFTVVNTSAGPATRWTVTWTLGSGQSVSSAWNAAVTVSGTTATAVNAPYNGTLAAGASTTFGLQLAGTGPVPTPLCTDSTRGRPAARRRPAGRT